MRAKRFRFVEAARVVDRGDVCQAGCVFRAKSAADSGMKSATDSDLISAIPM
jgi:hypothetical protein